MVRGISGMNAALALALLAGAGARIVPDEVRERHEPSDLGEPEQAQQEAVTAPRPPQAAPQPSPHDIAAMNAATARRSRRQAKRASLAQKDA